MVEVVSTVSLVQNTTLKQGAQSGTSASAAQAQAEAATPTASGQDFVSSSIRVDNLQNVAILEYRSSSGEVVQQYPNQSQIEAFKQAEHLGQKVVSKPASSSEAAPKAESSGGDSSSGGSSQGATSVTA